MKFLLGFLTGNATPGIIKGLGAAIRFCMVSLGVVLFVALFWGRG